MSDMDETASYPPIEPSNFDLIVIGTGLPESIVAAAASAVGKKVLHLDPNPYYGSHFASLPLEDLITFFKTQSQSSDHPLSQSDASNHFTLKPLSTRPLYTSLETTSFSSKPLESSRRFSIDLTGPKVLFCGDQLIDLILKTDVNQYMEFKSIDASFIGDKEGNLESVPDSRSGIFKDKGLSFKEKNQLMRFFKLVKEHFGSEESGERKMIDQEDLERPFAEFLTEKMGLSPKLKSIILYAITLADYDQENVEVCKDLLKTKDGIDGLALYHSSVGRFNNAPGAMIYPIYGQGELPQAFCRRAAVKGCIYVLRMPAVALIMDKDSGNYKGVKLVSGQELFSHQLVLGPSFIVPSLPAQPSVRASHDRSTEDSKHKLARAICITDNSLKPDIANCLVFYPPRSLNAKQATTVHVLQLSSNVAVCPPGMFVTYLSASCADAAHGNDLLRAAMSALFSLPESENSANNLTDHDSDDAEPKVKPSLLWSTVNIQELTLQGAYGAYDSISYTPMMDGDLHYEKLVGAVKELFQKMYPDEEFFPKTSSSNEVEDEGEPETGS